MEAIANKTSKVCHLSLYCTEGRSLLTLGLVDLAICAHSFLALQLTDKLVEKIGVQRTPAANPEMYKSDDYSVHLKGTNKTEAQDKHDQAGKM